VSFADVGEALTVAGWSPLIEMIGRPLVAFAAAAGMVAGVPDPVGDGAPAVASAATT
jgi:hypothetical protein